MAEENEGSAPAESTVETSRADDIAAAFDVVEARDAPAPAADAAPTETGAPAAAPATSPPLEGRDALGRFAPKRETTGGVPAGARTPLLPQSGASAATSAAPQPAAPEVPPRLAKAPASWAPTEAAHWDKTPAEVREAIVRRESEVQRVMQEAASARSGLSTLQQVISPYLPNINAANGGDVVSAIKTFFDYDNRLRHGSQLEKAQAVTQLIKGYGVDIAALDNELAGAPHAPETAQQNAIQAALQRELAPLRAHLAAQEQARQRAEQESLAQTAEQVGDGLAQFAADTAHPHYDAVRSDMADILEIALNQNRRMSLQEAYERACWQNPQIRGILVAGQQSAGAQAQHQAAQRARSAAVGVRNAPRAGAPAALPSPENRSRADDIAAAIAAHAGEV